MSAECNLYSYMHTCMRTWPWFEKKMCSEAGWDCARQKVFNRAVVSVILICHAFCSYSKLFRLLHSLSWTGDCYHESEDHASNFKNCWTAPWKFSEWIYRRLISRKRSRATQESTIEIYRRFHFVNSSETFKHLCGFQETRLENGWNIFTSTTLCLQRQLSAKENSSSQKLASSGSCNILFSNQFLAGSLVEIWQLTRRQQIISIISRPIREKNRLWFFNIMINK